MEGAVSPLSDDIEALKTLLASATQRANEAKARLANAHARESPTEAVIAHLKLQLEGLEADAAAAEDDPTTEVAAEKTAAPSPWR